MPLVGSIPSSLSDTAVVLFFFFERFCCSCTICPDRTLTLVTQTRHISEQPIQRTLHIISLSSCPIPSSAF